MVERILEELKQNMEKSLKIFESEIAGLRSTRISSSLLETIKIQVYNGSYSLFELATVSFPQPNMVLIKPWDKQIIHQVRKGIEEANKELSIAIDGDTIKVFFPPMTEELRKNLIKNLGERAEKERIILRNLRRNALEKIESAKTNGEIGEDEMYRGKEKLDEIIGHFNKKLEEIVKRKEQEIMEV
jgi:ribosome recycling factor